jgi:CBS domain-containing protein
MKQTSARPRSVDSITVSEIMSRGVWTVTPETQVGDVIRLFSEEQISGAPVVTDNGELKGVVSVTDVLRLAADEPESAPEETDWEEAWDALAEDDDDSDVAPRAYFLDVGSRSWMFRPSLAGQWPTSFDDHTVADIMTQATFTVRPQATIRELSRFLIRARIHRALVVEGGKLVGIVTAFDVVRAIAG